MDLSQEISKLADLYDPEEDERKAAGADARALVQGILVGTMLQQQRSGVISIRDVHQEVGADGTYLPYFTVVMDSGHRIRVSAEVE